MFALDRNLFGIVRKPRNLCIIREDLHFHQSAFFRPNAASYSGWEEIRKSVIQVRDVDASTFASSTITQL